MAFLISLLPVAGCGFMMWFCARGMRRGKCTTSETDTTGEIEELRAEVAQLRSQMNVERDAFDRNPLDR